MTWELRGTTGRVHLNVYSAGPVVPREARRQTLTLTSVPAHFPSLDASSRVWHERGGTGKPEQAIQKGLEEVHNLVLSQFI